MSGGEGFSLLRGSNDQMSFLKLRLVLKPALTMQHWLVELSCLTLPPKVGSKINTPMPGRHQFTPHPKLYLNAVAFFWFPQKTNLRSRECIQVKDVLYKTPRERKQERLKRGKWKGKKQKQAPGDCDCSPGPCTWFRRGQNYNACAPPNHVTLNTISQT